ncbi:hypothetical protein [Croceimicrobium sp.]|uniref:hypothetical protein n=1 Tax=Croceimicrobium sp. TaxID=2828340 RepID=UPI003BA9C109
MLKESQISAKLALLRDELENLISFFEQNLDYNLMVYDLWNAKDILGHITFWHESFARNISHLGKGLKPKPLKGKLSEVNNLSVDTTKAVSIQDLIERLKDAQKVIEEFIFLESISTIPYKKGSREYSREEHLEIVTNHIRKHLQDLRKKYFKS